MTYKRAQQKGFTLLELLVVIAIIGILSSVIIARTNSTRNKARDANRVAQMTEIRKAMELYYTQFNQYPLSRDAGTRWTQECSGGTWNGWVIPELVTEGYLPQSPIDPLPCPAHYGFSYASNGLEYKLVAHTDETGLGFGSAFIDPALDGGTDPCIIDGTDIEHFAIYSSKASNWVEIQNFPPALEC